MSIDRIDHWWPSICNLLSSCCKSSTFLRLKFWSAIGSGISSSRPVAMAARANCAMAALRSVLPASGFLWACESLRSGLPVFRKELQGPETECKGMHVRIHTLQMYKYEQTIININSSNPRPTRVSEISRVKGNTLLADCLGWGAWRKWYPFPAHHSMPRPTNTSEYAAASGNHHENWERSYSRGLEQAGK